MHGQDPADDLTVSVVLPVRDDAPALERCLRALAVQSVRPLEVVVVDDGSTDGSGDVARRGGAVVVREEEPGIAAAASRGYDAARGDLILRLDADSVPPPDWIARMTAPFVRDPGLAALSGPGVFSGLPTPLAGVLTRAYMGIYFRRIGARIGSPPLFGSNLAMRRTAWEAVSAEVHRHDGHVHDDLDLTMHLLPRFRTGFEPTLVVPVSARPLLHPFGMLERARRAAHTLRLHPDVRRDRLVR